jgi:CHAD domain-containing protein
MSSRPLELVLPADLDAAAATALIAERIGAAAGRPRTTDCLVLDTFDRRLRAAGLRAEQQAGDHGRVTLTLHAPGAPVRRAEVAAARAYSLTELPDGPLRAALAGVLEERALLPVVRLRSRIAELRVRNEDDKTVVRVVVDHAAALPGARDALGLTPRVVASPVRGYAEEFERVARRLREGLGLEPASEPLVDEAVRAVGGAVEGISSRPDVTLTAGMPSATAAGLVLTRLLEIAEANVPGTLDDLDTEFLHDLRVSVRRARSVLRELKHVFPERRLRSLRDKLKWVQGITGPLRDLDVQLLGWAELAGADAAELEPLHRLLVRRRADELAKVRRRLRGRRFREALGAWRELAAAPGGDDPAAELPVEAVAADRIRSVYRRMVRDGSAIDDDSPDQALHDLRKRGKELRYLLELFGGVFPADVVKPMVKTLKRLQDVLGEFQDLTVLVADLRRDAGALAAEPGGADALLAVGRLIAGLERRRVEVRAAFAERFAGFAAEEQRRLVRRTFPKLS